MAGHLGILALPIASPSSSLKGSEAVSQAFRSPAATKLDKSFGTRCSPNKPKSTSSSKRRRGGSTPVVRPNVITEETDRPSSTPTPTTEVFELAETSPRGKSITRRKHIPIVVPSYESLTREKSKTCESRDNSFSTSYTATSPDSLSHSVSSLASGSTTAPNTERPRYVEIKIPEWAQPVKVKRSFELPRLKLSTFIDPFAGPFIPSPSDASAISLRSSKPHIMGSNTPSPTGLYVNPANQGSGLYLSSTHSSQSSLVGTRAEYDSASEAENGHDPKQPGHAASSSFSGIPTHSQDPSPAAQSSDPNQTNLSGLVCNVHRTTGKEPHPLIGATTTILGDKLYVFGGRRLSRAKSQLTSNLYELDLVRRHWTKLETKGDIPPARYFHSVCALGDTKLVCYGGMSPSPAAEQGGENQSEVIVMSDIHIYDAPSRTWQQVATSESPQGRYAHCTAILPSGAVFGSANSATSAMHHNPQGTNPNEGRLGVSLDGAGGAEMVVVGGQDNANHYIEQISVFNLRSLKWTGTTGMGRQCGAYRSVVTPLTTMSAQHIGQGPHAGQDDDDDDEPATPSAIGSGAPMLVYSNYNFLDVKLELQVRLPDGTLTEKPMRTDVSPPGLRFPNGGVIDNHFVVSGTFLTSSKQEYALWALDLRTLSWSRIDAGGSIFGQGSWNRGVLWSRRNTFVILGNRKRSLVDDYNNRRINFTNICLVELEAFGIYDNARTAEPTSGFVSASAGGLTPAGELSLAGRQLRSAAESLGSMSRSVRELCDMDLLAIDGTRIPVNSRIIARRWGSFFTHLAREAIGGADQDTATLRSGAPGHPSRNSSTTITQLQSAAPSTHTQPNNTSTDIMDVRSFPPPKRPRLLYVPHTAPTVQALLHYLYTGTLPSPPSALATPQIHCSLLQLARPYKIDGLLEAIVQRLHESLDGRNAAAIFNAAAMAAGGGESIQFSPALGGRTRESMIPLRNASLANSSDGAAGIARSAASLRIDTDMANGRSTRNTLRPGEPLGEETETDEDEVPGSALTDASMSGSEAGLSARSLGGRRERDREVWSGSLSGVIGLQKRGLRGLMEGRRMRERGRSEVGNAGGIGGGRVGLGIA